MEEKKDYVGKLIFVNGDSSEYVDKESFIKALKDEIFYNGMGGVRFMFYEPHYTPEFEKEIDDICYNECGVDNPHGIDWYYLPKEKRGR